MQMIDRYGCRLTGSESSAVAPYDRALHNLFTLSNDPLADTDAALAADPGLVMAHGLRAALHLLGTEKALLPGAKAALKNMRAAAKGASPRELAHLAALHAFAAGSIADAAAAWEDVLIEFPEDALAMYCAHQCDFFLGRSQELRDRVSRRLGSLDRAWAGYGLYRGMHAFGLEEMNQYEEAEEAGREAIAREKRDAWAIHAVAHVMEMTARTEDGAKFLTERTEDWATDNFFQCHNWWHLALYRFETSDFASVLSLYDEKIKGGHSTAMLDMIDASALLWRLKLHGIDTGGRFEALTQVWEPRIGDAWYSFNDVHAMLAFAGAEKWALAKKLLTRMRRAAQGESENARNTRTVSLPAAEAMLAYAQGRYAEASELLAPLRAIAAQAGGSHAQRDLLTQTLIRAAELSGRRSLALALLNERVALKPRSPLARLWREKALRPH